MNRSILKVLVGSRAHGLAREDSDYDYRGVFVAPTRDLLRLYPGTPATRWVEADKAAGEKADDMAWELGYFLRLAAHCNPTILEVFAAPIVDGYPPTEDGMALRALFPYVWNPRGVRDAFVGYGLNQRKKFLDDKDKRGSKYAVAYLRVLWQAYWLLSSGELRVNVRAHDGLTAVILERWRAGAYTLGEVVDTCEAWRQNVESAAAECRHEPDLARVDEFLLDVRRRCW